MTRCQEHECCILTEHSALNRFTSRESTLTSLRCFIMTPNSNSNGPQTLLIDADDTLWENNIYFERAIATFISFLNHHEY